MMHGKITYLDGFRMHRGLMGGIRQVVSREQHLNKINVFPVPDENTGTNLSFTLLSIMERVDKRVEPHAGRTAIAIANLLRATPVLSITKERTVDMAGIFFGRRDIAKGLAKWAASRIDRDQTYNIFVSHARCPAAARRPVDLLPDLGYRCDWIHITETGAALGAHTGSGSLILALQPAGLA